MILVTGSTGNTGSEVVGELARRGAPVRALVRDAGKAAELFGADVQIAQGDYERPDTLEAAMDGVEAVYLVAPASPDMVALEANVIEAAKRMGVRRVVKHSALGAAPDSPIPVARWHGESERRLAESGLAYALLQPNFFMQNFLDFAPTIASEGAIYAPMKDGRISMIDCRDIAAVAATVFTEEGHEGETYVLTGPEALSFGQAAKKLSRVIGKEVRYVDISPEQAKQAMVEEGMPEWFADDLVSAYQIFSEGHGAMINDVVARVAGREPRTFEEFACEAAPAF